MAPLYSKWKTICAGLVLFALPTKGDVEVEASYMGIHGNKTFFTDSQFTRFYQCLSSRETKSCTAWYRSSSGTYRVTAMRQSLMKPSEHIESSFYTCVVHVNILAPSNKIVCSKTSISCDDKNKYQRFNFTTTGSLKDDCVGITSDRNLSVNTDDRFESCEGDCYDGSSTVAVTIPGVTTPVVPTNVTTTDTLLAHGATNASASLTKEHNTDNNTGIIVGVTVTFIILIVLIVLAIFFWRKLKRHRKTSEENHQASNFEMSPDNLDMGGYENTLNMHGEDVLGTGPVATPNTYSDLDYRNQDTTTNSNNNEITSVDGFSSPDPSATAKPVPEMLQDEGEAPLPGDTSSTSDDRNIESIDNGSNTGSPYSVARRAQT